MSYKKILITGSCGFVLSNFLRQCVYEKQPYQLVSIDKLKSDTMNSMYWNKNHTFYIADVTDPHIIDTIFMLEKPDIVIHGADESNVNQLSDNINCINCNILGLQTVINSCIKYNVNKIIYLSTDKVYGEITNDFDKSWVESDNINPRSLYATSKASAELLIKSASITHGLKYNIIRSSNIFGPRQRCTKLIPKTIKAVLENTPISIYGSGLQVRDWVHIYDNCNGIMTIINKGADNETYNLTANYEFTNLEVVQKICNVMHTGHNLITNVNDKSLHNFKYSMDSSKLRKLGWKPNYKFTQGIIETVEWYKINQWFLK
jgi:dTDP-glucose 4,6-dehydratase